MKNIIKRYFEKHPDVDHISGFGWLENSFPGKGPAKEHLDEISMDIPIFLMAESGHSLWVNSKALELAGITKDTIPPPNGQIEKSDTGELWGTIRNDMVNIAMPSLPDSSVEDYKSCLKEFIRYWNSKGIVGFFEAWSNYYGPNLIEALKELTRECELNAYISGSYCIYPFKDISEQIREYSKRRREDSINEHFRIDTIKIFEDGAYEVNRTAYILEPYSDNPLDDPDYRSAPFWEQNVLTSVVEAANGNDFKVHIHCIGDAAVHESVNAIAASNKKLGKRFKNVIVHLENLASSDIPRFKEEDIIPVVHPIWATRDPWNVAMDAMIGEKRSGELWRIGTLVKEGVLCAAGTDYPAASLLPSGPLLAIEQGVTRRMAKATFAIVDYGSGKYAESLGIEYEKITLDEAVKLYTIGRASAISADGFTGSIEVGKNADFLILDQNIFDIPIEEVSETNVVSTFLKGEEIYSLERDGVLSL
jgi:predicted amidohydrolase YtcJ